MKIVDRKARLAARLVLLLALASGLVQGQIRREVTEPDLLPDTERNLTATSVTSALQSRVAMESVIDPEKYFIGPSDLIAVGIWMNPPFSTTLTVTPEGTLVIPTVGEVRVADLTLADAKRRVLAAIRKRYVSAEISVTLVAPRPIVVIVSGQVLNPGSYVLSAVNRADKAIEEANRPQRTQMPGQQSAVERIMSRRTIVLRHRDGAETRVDLGKYHATGDDRWNPYLREGDMVIVPTRDLVKNVYAVYGAVVIPGRVEFVPGDSLKDALRIAYGFTPAAVSDSIELARPGPTGKGITSRFFDGNAILSGKAPDVSLASGDRIIVRRRLDLGGDDRVRVGGEVRYPGYYPIIENRTRLSEVLAMAGGFTAAASIGRSELIRHSVAPEDIMMDRLESFRGGVSPEDSVYYSLETELRLERERVTVDFVGLFVRGDSTQDVRLRSEDEVNVPARSQTIYIFGQVVSPGNVPFVPGQSVDKYIKAAGGFTDRAREGDIKVVKGRTRQWLSPSETSVEEGDYVWVPKEPERSFAYYMNILGQTAAVIGVAVSVALLTIQLNK